MTSKEYFDQEMSGEPLHEESVIEGLDGYCAEKDREIELMTKLHTDKSVLLKEAVEELKKLQYLESQLKATPKPDKGECDCGLKFDEIFAIQNNKKMCLECAGYSPKPTKSELPTEKYISDIAEGLANEYSSDKKDPVWRDIKQDGIKAIKAFIQSLPQSDGQRYGEWDKFMLQRIRRYFLSKSALPFEKDAYLFIDKLFQTLQSKEQEPKGSEERSDKLEAFLDYCNVNKAKIIEDYNKSLAQEPKGSDGEEDGGSRLYKGKRIFP